MIEELDQLEEKIARLLDALNQGKARVQQLETENQQLKQQAEEVASQSTAQESAKQNLETKVQSLEKEVSDYSGKVDVSRNKLLAIIANLDKVEIDLEKLKPSEE